MNRPTAEQIIKAFEVCRDKDLCNECPYEENIDCLRLREKHAIELIKDLTGDNEDLNKTISSLLETIKSIQADTVRKMAERIKQAFRNDGRSNWYIRKVIDQTANDMLEGETQ